jgi:5S rRNA maturation endonuclease (ribonuclease M5)
MLSPEERLDLLEKVLDELRELSESIPVIVEGRRDVQALKRLGITRNVRALHEGSSIMTFCESIAREHARAVVLTDWDKRGGRLARNLKDGFEANGVSIVGKIRTQIVILSKKEVKDVEGLPTFIERLRVSVGR